MTSHLIRAVLSGLALGLGIALLLIQHGRIALGTMAPMVIVIIALVIQIGIALVAGPKKPS